MRDSFRETGSPAESPAVATGAKKQPAKKRKQTEESPPFVIHPKGGKGNARSKPGKGKGKDKVSEPNLGFESRLCEGKVLTPLRICSTLRDPLLWFLSKGCGFILWCLPKKGLNENDSRGCRIHCIRISSEYENQSLRSSTDLWVGMCAH